MFSTLRGRAVPTYTHTHNLYGLHPVHQSYFVSLCVWNVSIYVVLRQRENSKITILDIHDQKTTRGISSKGTPECTCSLHQSVSLIQIVHLKNKLLSNNVTFDIKL